MMFVLLRGIVLIAGFAFLGSRIVTGHRKKTDRPEPVIPVQKEQP